MANLRKINKLVNDASGKYTDKQFFMSSLYLSFLIDMVNTVSKRYNYGERIRLKTVWGGNTVAGTDNRVILINLDNFLCQGLTRTQRHRINVGVLYHELLHILFTDFIQANEQRDALAQKTILPKRIVNKAEIEAILDEYSPNQMKNLVSIFDFISNAIEDGYVNKNGNEIFASYAEDLKYSNDIHRQVGFVPFKKMIAEETKSNHPVYAKLISIVNLILEYSKFENIDCDEEDFEDERMKMVVSTVPYIDSALYGDSDNKFFQIGNVFATLFPLIDEAIKEMGDETEQPQNQSRQGASAPNGTSKPVSSGGSSGTSNTQQTTQQMSSTTLSATNSTNTKTEASGNKNSTGGESDNSSGTTSANSQNYDNNTVGSNNSSESNEANSNGTNTSSQNEDNDNSDKISDSLSSTSDSTKMPDETNSGNNEEDNSTSSEKNEAKDNSLSSGLNIPNVHMSYSANGENNEKPEVESMKDEDNANKGCFRDGNWLETLQGKIKKKPESVKKEEADEDVTAAAEILKITNAINNSISNDEEALESLVEEALNELNDDIDYGDVHIGVNARIVRTKSISPVMKSQYDEIKEIINRTAKHLTERTKSLLEEKANEVNITGLYSGRTINRSAVARNDGRVFMKKKLPDEDLDMAVCVLIDGSGSMSDCKRMTYAKRAALLLYRYCEILKIPCGVYLHRTMGYEDCTIECYADPERYMASDKYRIMSAQAFGGNRDGYAIRYCCNRLNQIDAKQKLMFVISDGAPSAYDYDVALADIKKCKKEYERKGVQMIAAAIGCDKKQIEEIYGNSFLDVSDLQTLPKKLCNILNRKLRRRL